MRAYYHDEIVSIFQECCPTGREKDEKLTEYDYKTVITRLIRLISNHVKQADWSITPPPIRGTYETDIMPCIDLINALNERARMVTTLIRRVSNNKNNPLPPPRIAYPWGIDHFFSNGGNELIAALDAGVPIEEICPEE